MFRSPFITSKPRRDSERDLKQRLDALVSLITRLETSYCVLCGWNNFRDLEAMHYWHRAMMPTRYDIDNLATGCRQCNQKHETNPEPYRVWLLKKLGQEAFDDLAQRAHSSVKLGYVELRELCERYGLLLAEAKGNQ